MDMYGIDVSHWNGVIDFARCTASFVIMKLSQATHKDVKFEEYYNNCKIPKGVYIYNKVKNVSDAQKEAEFAVKSLNGRKLECGVWLDLEDSTMKKLGKATLNSIIQTESDILRKAGYNVGIYCNKDWYVNVLDSKSLCKSFPFWIARYPSLDKGVVKESLSPFGYEGCTIWQFSSKGKVLGLNGNVDMNISHTPIGDWFNNTIAMPTQKSIEVIAQEVIEGKWGNGIDRKNRLHSAGYDYAEVQKVVNRIIKGK